MKQYQRNALAMLAAVLIIGIMGLVALEPALSATEDTATGSFTLNAVPGISNVDFTDQSYTVVSSMDPYITWYHVNFTVTSSAGIADILNVTIWIYDDSLYGANYNTSSPDGLQLTQFLWIEATDTWSVSDQGSMSLWQIDNDTSIDAGAASASTSVEFAMNFTSSYVARYDTDWNVTAHVYDDDGTPEVAYAAETALVTMNQYFNVSYSASTYSWGSGVEPSSINNTHGALSINILANAQWEILINSTDFNTSGQSDVDIEAQNILIWDEDGSNGGSSQYIRNTQAVLVGSWDNQAAMATESAITRNCYFFLSPGVYFVVGYTWSTWTTAYIQANA